MQNNRVFINDQGIIEIQVRGDQTVASVQAMGDQTMQLAGEQQAAGKPVLILDNLLEMGKVPAEARRRVVDLIKSNNYHKLAMLGSDPLLKFGANLLIQATGKSATVRYFDDRKTCDAWLLKS